MNTDQLDGQEDTYFSMSWVDFKTIIAKHGFQEAFSYSIERHGHTDEVALFFNTEKGLVIFADSFGEGVNHGALYGEVKCKKGHEHDTWCAISTGGLVDGTEDIFNTCQDVREGLFRKIARLEDHADFLPKWVDKDRLLWFVDSEESKATAYDYKRITQRKIEMCPPEFREIVGR